MNLYPLTAPIILNDVIYEEYGGNLDTCTPLQRQAAYLIAEKEVSEMLETFLLPVTVTGTYSYAPLLMLDHSYIITVNRVEFIEFDGDVYWSQDGVNNDYIAIRDDSYGLVDINYLSGYCHCHTAGEYPYRVRVSYTAGFPTGTASQADFLLGLTTYAQIILNEIIGFGNEAPGDIGVQNFKNQEYSEQRVGLFKTALGSSPKAHFANRIFTKYKKRRWVGM